MPFMRFTLVLGVRRYSFLYVRSFFPQGLTEFSSKYERIIARHLGHGLDRTAFTKFCKAMIVAMKDILAS